MELMFTARGHSCDLIIHPVSKKTAQLIREHGVDVYSMKSWDCWSRGKTSIWGMRIDNICQIQVTLDGEPVAFDHQRVIANPLMLRRRMFLDSRAKYLCVFGFDNARCKFSWRWSDVKGFDPAKFEFMVYQWDRIMGREGYHILDDIRYDNRVSASHDWCDAAGFTLVRPRLINLEDVRREIAEENAERADSPFSSVQSFAEAVTE
ncbi:MAG: hypothetical protein PWQ57_2061 [Desulfovibrionales bacterium]|nr:hypothetical protein [Desulfovibrionales bacterium]